jgi:hypothetical protein
MQPPVVPCGETSVYQKDMSNTYQGGDYTGRYAVLQEINVCQIKLTHFIFLGCSDGKRVILSGVKRG